VAAARIAGRFHETLARAALALVERADAACAARADAARGERLPVALSGGCFQNALLAERVSGLLGDGRRVLRHGAVPPGDGGIALGQAVVAAAVLQEDRSACV
jgi:hydrogenase maturation protein HypF